MPLDAFKTGMQVDGNLTKLKTKMDQRGPIALFDGAMGR
jgi:hypothetical protein